MKGATHEKPVCSLQHRTGRASQGLLVALATLGGLLLGGCSVAHYYAQSIRGHLALMSLRQPLAAATDTDQAPALLRQRLQKTIEMREFAVEELALPDNGSYRSYVDVGRPYVVWNVFAAPEFSLRPKRWCFPIAGCVPYRGYFSKSAATAFADKLRGDGHDVYVAGVRAYSTLGWFDDPVLNTMLELPDASRAGIMFHELAHQRLYLADDATFNEGFAVAVQREGVRRWLQAQVSTQAVQDYERRQLWREQSIALVAATRDQLSRLYAKDLLDTEMRARKARILDEMRARYRKCQPPWAGVTSSDSWINSDLNNAKLASISTYYELVPAFERLLQFYGRDLPAFYGACVLLTKLPQQERSEILTELSTTGGERIEWRLTRTLDGAAQYQTVRNPRHKLVTHDTD